MTAVQLQMLDADAYHRTGDADPIEYYRVPLIGRLFAKRVTDCLSLLPEGRRVLDVGYGSGVSFLNLAEKFDEIHGIDPHAHALDVEKSFRAAGLTPRLRQGTITALPYENDTFDAAVAISIHEEIPPEVQARAFAEIRRVVRPGGCYVVGVPGVNAMMTLGFLALGCDMRKWHITTERQVLAAMRERFEVDRTKYSPAFLPRSMTTYLAMRGWKR